MNRIIPRCAAWLLIVASCHVLRATPPDVRMPVVPSDDVIEFDWDQCSFELPNTDKVDLALLPDKIRALHGQRVRVRGYMWPSFKRDGISQFLLQSFIEMRFGSDLPVDSVIAVSMKYPNTATYTTRPVIVEGTLTIDDWMFSETRDEAILVYRLAADAVGPPKP